MHILAEGKGKRTIKMLVDQLRKSAKIEGAREAWRTYRETITQLIMEEMEIGDTLLILGAGACNDIDLKQLLPYAKKFILVDRFKEAMEEAVAYYEIPPERVEILPINLWNIKEEEFEKQLEYQIRIPQLLSFLQEEAKRALEEKLPDIQADFVVNIGLYSQLNAVLASLFYLKREPYGLKEREMMQKMFSWLNQEAVKKINQWIFQQCQRGLIGYEYAVFGTEEEERNRCQQLQMLFLQGQTEWLQEQNISRVEGGWQAESDLARRYRTGELTLTRNAYPIWNFLEQKQYLMQIYCFRVYERKDGGKKGV